MAKKWSSSQIVVQHLGDCATIDVAKKERFRVSDVEDRGLTKIELHIP